MFNKIKMSVVAIALMFSVQTVNADRFGVNFSYSNHPSYPTYYHAGYYNPPYRPIYYHPNYYRPVYRPVYYPNYYHPVYQPVYYGGYYQYCY